MGKAEKQKKLDVIAGQVAQCTRCGLSAQANKPVPGEGNPEAKIMFIGEGPGFHEDQKGIPFCGAAGKLLDQLLQLIKVEKEEVWIGNVVKHRPPGNRDPLPEEIEACRYFLDEQIKVIDPKIVVTLGRFSMRKFLPEEYISRIHGQARYIDFKRKRLLVIPMYHPAAALRNGRIMEAVKEDFKKINLFLGGGSESGTEEEKPKEEQLSLIN